MRLMIVHLSDLHLTSGENPALVKSRKLVEAIRNLDYRLDACALVLSGDIAYSGKSDEYLIALEYVEEIKRSLANELPHSPEMWCAMVPGNHDCDLVPGNAARSTVVDHLAQRTDRPLDPEIVALCTSVQDEFFGFRDTVCRDGLIGTDRLYYEYRFRNDNEAVVFRCYNTAWLSKLREEQGSLYFPVERIPAEKPDASVVISVLHHPYNWLNASSYRDFRARVEQVSDIVLTGHEHAAGRRSESSEHGERNQYIEGGAIQEQDNADVSSFNVLVIDTKLRRQRYSRFAWDDEMYVPLPETALRTADEDSDAAWEEFQVNRLRAKEAFLLTPRMSEFLEDPGVDIDYPGRGRLKLSELFMYPDIREVKPHQWEFTPVIRGDDVFEHLQSLPHTLITAPEQAGKTALAKRLFVDFHAQGDVPLWVDAGEFKATAEDKVIARLHRLFGEQYDAGRLEHFRQLDRARRVIIVDDFHKLKPRRGESIDTVLDTFGNFAGRLIFFANDLAHQLSELVDPRRMIEGHVTFRHYRIQQFGYAKRDALVDKWFMLRPTLPESDEEFATDLNAAKRTLNTLFSRNFVPSYPVFIIAVLQGRDAGAPVNVTASTYGYFFELFIKHSLALGSTRITYDIKTAYLAQLAWEMYRAGETQISEDEFRNIHEAFNQKKALPLSFTAMRDDLLKGRVLAQRGDAFWFKYRYLYYYFVAAHIRDTIATAETRGVVTELSQRLHDEDSANIMLFLTHVSKDPLIVHELLRNAREIFREYDPARLGDDVGFLTGDAPSLELQYVERDVAESRRALLERMDELAAEADSREEETETATTVATRERSPEMVAEEGLEWRVAWLTRLGMAFKTLQILGQILKNFPGSLDAEEKEDITRECYLLGLRTLGAVFSLVKEFRTEMVRYLVDVIRAEHPAFRDRILDYDDTKEVIVRAQETLFGLAHGAAYGSIQRIAYAVGSPELEITYATVLKKADNDAFSLIDIALRLDQYAKFPTARVEQLGRDLEGYPLALSVLRRLVVNHFYLFPVELDVRQHVCQALNIPVKRVLGKSPRMKLIEPPKR